MSFPLKYTAVLLPFALAACTTVPTGPNIMVLPGKGKTLAQFQADDQACRSFSSAQIGAPAKNTNDAAGNQAQTTATANANQTAAQQARYTSAGSNYGDTAYYELQVRYDNAYQQCMFTKGHRIPVVVNYAQQDSSGNINTSSQAGAYRTPPNTQKAPPEKYIVK